MRFDALVAAATRVVCVSNDEDGRCHAFSIGHEKNSKRQRRPLKVANLPNWQSRWAALLVSPTVVC